MGDYTPLGWVRERGLRGWKEGLSLGAYVQKNNNLLLFQKLIRRICIYPKFLGEDK
jgi:hypothetical protein